MHSLQLLGARVHLCAPTGVDQMEAAVARADWYDCCDAVFCNCLEIGTTAVVLGAKADLCDCCHS